MDNKPLVSMLVPAYNVGKHIRRFLESALNQNFENYEIVCVDDASTDDTLEILEEYRRRFPDKLVVVPATEHHGSIGKVRSHAFECSKGDYIFWCDSDDIIHPNGLSVLYEEALNGDYDLVCGWAMMTQIGDDNLPLKMFPLNKKQTQDVSVDTEIMSDANFWVRLIKRTLIEEVGPVTEGYVFDDVAYLPVLKSYAKKVRHVDQLVYYYYRRVGSTSNTPSLKVAEGSVLAEKYALEHCNPKHIKAVQYFVAERTTSNLNDRWPFYDIFAKWAKEQMEWLNDNELVKNNKRIHNALQEAAKNASSLIPNKICLSDFDKITPEERVAELREKVFYDGCEIISISKDNCDLDSNEYVRDALNSGKTELASDYFALKNIYENGGFYIHNRVRILNFFSYLKNQNAVFFRLDKTSYSKFIFGAAPKNEAIEAILDTFSYKWDKRKAFIPLDERIKIVLTAKYGIPLNGGTVVFSNPVSVIPMHNGVVNVEWGKTFCEHDFSDYADNKEYITIKKSTLMDMVSVITSSTINRQQANRNAAIVREFENMKQSNTYKLMMKIRSVGDSPVGPPLKKVFHGMLKVRKKLKRK